MLNDLVNTITKEKVIDDNISPIQPKVLNFSEHKNFTNAEEDEKEIIYDKGNSYSEFLDYRQKEIKEEIISKLDNSYNQMVETTETETNEWINILNEEKEITHEHIKESSSSKKYSSNSNFSEKTSHVEILDQSTTSSGYTVSKAHSIVCKKHGQVHLGIDHSKFRLVCKKCVVSGQLSELESIDDFQNSQIERDEEIYCDNHHTSKGIFFCDDCNQFLCKECFAHAHRKHNSNLPSFMSIQVKEEIKHIIDEILRIKPNLEESLEEISSMNEKIKKIRENSLRAIKGTVEKISHVSKSKFEKLNKEPEKIYKGLDSEVEGVYNRLLGLQIKANKYIAEINVFINKIDPQSVSFNICRDKRSKSSLFTEIKTTIEDSKNFLSYKIQKCVNEVKDKKEKIDKEINHLYKNMKLFENSIMTSIQSGMKNFSIVLRRFPKFSRKGFKYYKTSSLVVKVDKSIFLAGLGLCGLYVSSRLLEDKYSKIYFDMNERGKISIDIKISEMRENQNDTESIETHVLYGIINKNDPINLIYFKKAVFLKPNTKYLVSVVNNDPNPMIDIWSGEVNKLSSTSMNQIIPCNCSDVTFHFSSAEGIESDFNEFNMGVIANLIYCKAD